MSDWRLDQFYKTDREYSLAPTDDLIRLRRSKVKVTAAHQGGKGIHVYAGALKSIFELLFKCCIFKTLECSL